jgi:hypothetical protein
VAFSSTGAVEVQTGTLSFQGGGTFTGGSVASPGGIVQLAAGAYTINGAVLSTNVQVIGGTLTGNNVIRGALDWVFGDWNGAGSVTIASNSVLSIVSGNDHNLPDCAVTNFGTVAWSGGRIRGGGNAGTQVYNFGLWDGQSDQAFNADYDGANVLFNNAGTLRKSGGVGATVLPGGVLFSNTGTVNVESGTLSLQGGGSFTGGSVTSAAGLIQLAAGAYTINGTITTTNVQLVGGTLGGTNVLRGGLSWVFGDWNGAGGVTIVSNSVLSIVSGNDHNMADCMVVNFGTVAWSSGRIRGGGNAGTQVNNFGLWDAQSDQVFNADYDAAGMSFNNAGTLRKSAGGGITSLLGGVAFNNTGTVEVLTGIMSFNGGYSQTGGTLSFGISSLTDFGQISISGNAPLTGTLNINLRNGFQPGLGDTFQVMTYSSRTGTFTAVTGCSIGNGLFFDVMYENTRLLLVTKDGAPHLDSFKWSFNNGQFQFRLTTGTSGQTYVIEASTTLTNWVPISTNALPDCVLEFVDTNAVNFPYRFYRALLVP